eukprot:CAMPEP_0185734332 /NCGR_PEP_ID=MMETSP1171-20130828/22161_1 /TAXON_ID=374046 /ORGANISM="Helicotheca tamensis, Strain CCMP826" /LENGTH=407 /DNA_ID=CAMNT_0028404301 /DNA_START=242 /DNA_END=1465 /DNA_ORIENTATION=+
MDTPSRSTLTTSLRMTSSVALSSQGEDEELIKQIQTYTNLHHEKESDATLLSLKEASTEARKKLLTKHIGLVHHTVGTILRRRSRKSLLSLTRHDLEQEGFLGLNRAVDSYKLNKGASFPTYAVYWIRAYVHRAIAKEDNLIRIPEYVLANLRKLHGVANQLQMDLDLLYSLIIGKEGQGKAKDGASTEMGRTQEEMWSILQSETGFTDKQIKECLRVREWRKHGGYTHLQPWMHQDDAFKFSSSAVPNPEDVQGTNPEDLKKMLSQYLRPKEVEAISWRYGLNEDEVSSRRDGVSARDYEAEAEYDLFGPESHLTSTSLPQPSKAVTNAVAASRKQRHSPARKAAPTTTLKRSIPKKGKWGEDMSFAEIGARMAVSAEYTRRLTKVALEKLRKAVEEGRLEPDFLV